LILGISISALLVIVMISGFFLFNKWKSSQARVDKRFPLQRLSYCSSDQVTPCIVSFSLDSHGDMLVNFLTTGAFYPDFYLKIRQNEDNHIYTCQRVNKFATSVYCTGAIMPLGETLQFSIFSINEDVLLAEGNFPIIGLALGTPEVALSPTSGTPFTPSPTEELLQTPTLVGATPISTSTPTPTLNPSYPNPTSRTPSYPNPKPP
jgi:hypothetical protein